MSTKLLRAAILGCGSFARQHARVMVELAEQIELVAFCDRHLDRASALSQEFTAGSAAVYTSHQELVEQAGLDLLVISLPPYGHTNEVELAARKGIHLLIEKPIALSSESAWQMVTAAETAGIKTQVGFKFRFGAAIEKLKKMLESGEAGQAGLFSARYFANSLHASWWRMREKSGGQLVEQGIHMLDLARYLMGDAVTVYSRQANLFHQAVPDYSIEDVSATVITFQNGSLGVIYVTNAAIPNRWINDYRLVAQAVTAEFADANHATIHFTAGQAHEPLTIAADQDVLKQQTIDLVEAIRTGRETRTPIREGALTLDLALGARQSAQERCEVRLS